MDFNKVSTGFLENTLYVTGYSIGGCGAAVLAESETAAVAGASVSAIYAAVDALAQGVFSKIFHLDRESNQFVAAMIVLFPAKVFAAVKIATVLGVSTLGTAPTAAAIAGGLTIHYVIVSLAEGKPINPLRVL